MCAGAVSLDEIILIDRAVDMITPMCTQLTYEGLVDEILGIRNGSVSMDKEGKNALISKAFHISLGPASCFLLLSAIIEELH